MATYQDGNVRKATANTVTAMIRSAESRRCPQCLRKSALRLVGEPPVSACRWADEGRCDYDERAARLHRIARLEANPDGTTAILVDQQRRALAELDAPPERYVWDEQAKAWVPNPDLDTEGPDG